MELGFNTNYKKPITHDKLDQIEKEIIRT